MKRLRVLCLIIASTMVFLLASCNSTISSEQSTTAAAATTTRASEVTETTKDSEVTETTKDKVSVSIMTAQHYEMPPASVDSSNNKFVSLMEKELNLDITWEIIPGDQYGDKTNLIMASGEMPDMLWTSQVQMSKWSGQGLLLPLDEVIAKTYPELLTRDIPEKAYVGGKINGKLYGIPTWYTASSDPFVTWLRQDWIKNLNLKVPTTIDEFYEVLKAFTFDDPDNNGKDDTFGLGTDKMMDGLDSICMFWGVSPGLCNITAFTFWSTVDGKTIPDAIRPETKDALAFIAKLYKEKILFNESIVHDFSQWEENLKSIYGCASYTASFVGNNISMTMVKDNPEAYYIPIAPVKGPNGDGLSFDSSGVEGFYSITSSAKNPDRLVEMFKWAYAGELNNTNADNLCFGINKEYTKIISGYPSLLWGDQLPEELRNDGYRYNYLLAWDSPNRYSDEEEIKYVKASADAGIVFKTFPDAVSIFGKFKHMNDKYLVVDEEGTYSADLSKKWEEVRVKIITGKAPIDEFDKWVEYYLKNGGQKIIDAVNNMQK